MYGFALRLIKCFLLEKREDPFTLLIRFIGMMGIRVLDLFRIFESGAHSVVTKENFIRGVKVIS